MNLNLKQAAIKMGLKAGTLRQRIDRARDRHEAMGWHKNESGHWVIDKASLFNILYRTY